MLASRNSDSGQNLCSDGHIKDGLGKVCIARLELFNKNCRAKGRGAIRIGDACVPIGNPTICKAARKQAQPYIQRHADLGSFCCRTQGLHLFSRVCLMHELCVLQRRALIDTFQKHETTSQAKCMLRRKMAFSARCVPCSGEGR